MKAQIYFATKAFITDLVILNEKQSSYSQELQLALQNLAQTAHVPSDISITCGKVFVLRGDLISEADHILLACEARVILSSRNGSLSDQVKRTRLNSTPTIHLEKPVMKKSMDWFVPELEFFNGYGGFTRDGENYVVVLKSGVNTPAPWINVIANQSFGFQVSELGSGYTWSANSRENQLTPWSNDPVVDPSGEAFYIYEPSQSRSTSRQLGRSIGRELGFELGS